MANISIGSEVVITNPEQKTIDWVERHYTFTNPTYTNNKKMGYSVWKVPKELKLYKKNKNKLILPYGFRAYCKNQKVTEEYNKPIKIKIKGKIDLYDYQKPAVDAMINAGYGVLQAPAGSGKTVMGIEIIKRLGLKTLWLTHTVDLMQQSKARFEQYFNCKTGTLTNGKYIDGDVVFSTVQSAVKFKDKLNFDVVICDECHRVGGSYTSASQFFKVLNSINAKYKYGLSASLHRADGLIDTVYAMLGPIQYKIEDSQSLLLNIKLVETNYSYDDSIKFNHSKFITQLASDNIRNKVIADLANNSEQEHFLILSHRVNQCNKLEKLIDDSIVVTGNTPERDLLLQEMRDGKHRVLISTYALAKEGLDLPILDSLIMATPIKDYAVVLQSCGRIARPYPNKKQPVVYDLIDNFWYSTYAFNKRKEHYKKLNYTIQ